MLDDGRDLPLPNVHSYQDWLREVRRFREVTPDELPVSLGTLQSIIAPQVSAELGSFKQLVSAGQYADESNMTSALVDHVRRAVENAMDGSAKVNIGLSVFQLTDRGPGAEEHTYGADFLLAFRVMAPEHRMF